MSLRQFSSSLSRGSLPYGTLTVSKSFASGLLVLIAVRAIVSLNGDKHSLIA